MRLYGIVCNNIIQKRLAGVPCKPFFVAAFMNETNYKIIYEALC